MNRHLTRQQRRAAAKAGLVLDIFSLLALGVAVLIGIVTPGGALAPGITLAIGITGGATYLYFARSRP